MELLAPRKLCDTCGSTLEFEMPTGFCPGCLLDTVLESETEAAPGSRINDYELLNEVARGGMGIVYRARQRMPSRIVALKMILPSHLSSPDSVARFRAEAEAAASLDHENILPIYAVGESDGVPFYSMKFADGGNLAARLDDFRSAPRKCAVLIATLARAVGHAHERGILHRDLKPGNVLFDSTGKPFVSDFGLAKWLERDGDLTQTLAILGTPYYMAPEQAAGLHSLTAAADIYSLGAILFHLLTGQPPFRGVNAMEVLRNAAERPATRPRSINRHIPADLETICLKCLEKNPGARYASAAALAEDLKRFCAGRIILARRAGVVTHGRRWIGRNRVVVALGTVASALLISLLLVVVGRVAAPALARSIAVLPFEDLSGEGENANFVGGIQDDVVTNLAKISQLKVISRSSVLTYKATPHNVREIAKTLGVGTVLEGSVRRAGNRVRVNVQLITAATDEQIWAEAYERDMTDVFAIQSDLALQIASKLKANLSSAQKARLQRKPTHSGEAYMFYIEANDIGGRYGALQDDLKKAEQLYEKAIQLDPSFALAFAQLSHVEIQLNEIYDPTPARYEKAVNSAKQALRLQPDLPEAHMAMGVSYAKEDWSAPAVDAEKAMTEFTIALRGSPNDANILTAIGRIERHQGNWAESTAHLEKAAALDPNNVERWHRLFFNHELTRNFTAASTALDHVIALEPDSWYYYSHQAALRYYWTGDITAMERMLSRPKSGKGPEGFFTVCRYAFSMCLRRFEDAERILLDDPQENFSRNGLYPIPKSLLLAHVYERLLDRGKAHQYFEAARLPIEQLVQQRPLDAGWHVVLAEVYAGLGREEDAIREARRATEIVPESDKFNGAGMRDYLAVTYLEVGKPDLALPIIERSLKAPCGFYINQLRLDPVFDSLHDNPRFQQLLKHYGANQTGSSSL